MQSGYGRKSVSGRVVALALATVGVPGLARAEGFQWDRDPLTEGVQDGAGTWNLTDPRWWDGAGNLAWPNDEYVATFGNGGTGGTVTIVAGVRAAGVRVKPVANGAYTFAGSLTLVGSEPTIANEGTAPVTVSAAITAGTVGVTKAGTGQVHLASNANNFTGPIRVTGGVLSFNAGTQANVLGNYTKWVLENGTRPGAVYGAYPLLSVAGASGTLLNRPVEVKFDGPADPAGYRVGIRASDGGGSGNTFTGGITMSGPAYGTLVLNDRPAGDAATGTSVSVGSGGINAMGMAGGGQILFRGASLTNVAGSIVAPAGVDVVIDRQVSSAVVSLQSGGNAWGRTLVRAGTLQLGTNNALPAAAELVLGAEGSAAAATFNMSSRLAQMIGGLSVNPGAAVGAALTVTGTAASATLAIDVAAGKSYAFESVAGGGAQARITGAIGIDKRGAGSQRFAGPNTYSGLTTVTEGTLELGSEAWGPVLTGAGTNVNGGRLVFEYGGVASPRLQVEQLLGESQAAGWAAGKIRSGMAASEHLAVPVATPMHALGCSDDGLSRVSVMYAYYGDLNLDGRVDRDDYARIDRGMATGVGGWVNGDVNYSGSVTAADYLLMDAVYLKLSTAAEGAWLVAEREARFGAGYVGRLVAAVPEPGECGVAAAVVAFSGRRRGRVSRCGAGGGGGRGGA